MTGRRPPIIGITTIVTEAEQNPFPPRIGQNQAYIRGLVRAGAAPLMIPQLADASLVRALYERLDGLVLPGGEDIDPARYGQARHEQCGRVSPERDNMELALARWAVEDGVPLLAICRGIQVLNVALGGSLYQDIAAQVPGAERHDWYPGYPRDRLSHEVAISPQTRLVAILGDGSPRVNSLHHQALKEVPPALTVVAHAPDGIVEAVEITDHPFALGVQWHPEELADGDIRAQRLFDALIEACQV
jgi:putative glutamine amidotransferase